jgi:hypothetical protein
MTPAAFRKLVSHLYTEFLTIRPRSAALAGAAIGVAIDLLGVHGQK